jgi:hypothetical protein
MDCKKNYSSNSFFTLLVLFFCALFLFSSPVGLSAQNNTFESFAYKVDKTYLKSYRIVAKKNSKSTR